MKKYINLSKSIRIARAFALIIGILLTFNNPAFSQIISGRVESNKGATISNASVYLFSQSSKAQSYSGTDAQGKFNVKVPATGKYILTIKSIGFSLYRDSITITADKDFDVIKLTPLSDTISVVKSLSQVNITGQKAITKHLDDREVIDVENSFLGKLPNTVDMLNQIPEITIDGSAISVLGKNGVAVYVNGHQSNLSIQSIPIQNIARIEIITNPSAKYDASMEAIINVVMKKGISNGIQGDFFGNYEQRHGNLYSIGGELSYNSGIFNSSLSVGYYEGTSKGISTNSNSIFENSASPYALNSDLKESNYGYLLNVDLEMALLLNKNNKISINGTWQPNYTPRDNFSEHDNFTNVSGSKIDSSTTSNVLWTYHTRYANGGISYINSNRLLTFETRMDIFWQDDGTKTYNDFSFLNFSSENSNAPITINTDQYRRSIAYVPSINFSHPFKQSKLEFGGKYYHISSNFYLNFSEFNFYVPDQNNVFSSTENIYAEYVNYSGTSGKLKYEFGLRNEYSTLAGFFNSNPNNYNLSKLLPSANLSYPTGKDGKLSLSYSEKLSRVPFARESPLFYYTGPFTAFEGNPQLRPQTLQSLQLKYVYKSYYTSLYYNNYDNFLGTLPFISGNTTILKYSNSKRVNYGVIIGAPIVFSPWWSSQNNLKIYHQENSGIIDSTKFDVGNWTSNINVSENFKVASLFKTALLFNYTLPYYNGVNRVKTGPSIDFNFSKSVAHKRMELGLYVRDVFDTYSYSYLSRNTEGVIYNANLRKDTRGISFSVKYNFQQGRSTEKAAESNDDIQSRL